MAVALLAGRLRCQVFLSFLFLWLCPPDLDFTQQLATTLRNKWLVFSFLQEITWRCSCAHMTVWTMAGEINEGTVRQTSHTPLDTTLCGPFRYCFAFLCVLFGVAVSKPEKTTAARRFSFSFFVNVDVFAWWSPDGSWPVRTFWVHEDLVKSLHLKTLH